MDDIVNNEFVDLIDNEISPMISDDMLPLINDDVVHIQQLDDSVRLMLEADRDVHQAVIAEKMALAVTEESEKKAADKTNLENIQQAEAHMKNAIENSADKDVQKLYAEFEKAFAI